MSSKRNATTSTRTAGATGNTRLQPLREVLSTQAQELSAALQAERTVEGRAARVSTPAPLSTQLPNTPENLKAIQRAVYALGSNATAEHPAYLRVLVLNGRIGHLGTANGPWQLDVFNPREEYNSPHASRTVSDSHASTAEGIARFVVGTLAGIVEYTAYPSERARLKADKAERMARRNPGVRL